MDVKDFDGDIYDWPKDVLGGHMKELEGLLRCGLCGGIFKAPQALQCGHVFCAGCLQTGANANKLRTQKCPSCRKDAVNWKAVPSVRAICEKYAQLRGILLEVVSSNAAGKPVSSDLATAGSGHQTSQKSMLISCADEIIVVEKSKKLPQPFWNQMKEKEIRRMVMAVGLSDAGDKSECKARYDRFRILWNIEIEETNPRSKAQIAAEVMEEEKAKKKSQKLTEQSAGMLNMVKKVGLSAAPPEMKSNFAKMAAELRRQNSEKKRKLQEMEEKKKQQTNDVISSDPSVCPLNGPEGNLVTKDKKMESSSPDKIQAEGNVRIVSSKIPDMDFYYNVDTGIGQLLPRKSGSKGPDHKTATLKSSSQLNGFEKPEDSEPQARIPNDEVTASSNSCPVQKDAFTTSSNSSKPFAGPSTTPSHRPSLKSKRKRDGQWPLPLSTTSPLNQVTPVKQSEYKDCIDMTQDNEDEVGREPLPNLDLPDSAPVEEKKSENHKKRKNKESHDDVDTHSPDDSVKEKSESQQWACKSCTFLNAIGIEKCQMCLTPNEKNSKKLSQPQIFRRSSRNKLVLL